jgi:serine/threonine-protein kinase
MHREAKPVSPRRYNPQISPVLEQIILKVLSKEPSQRYRSADQLGRVLSNISQRHEGYASSAASTVAASERTQVSPSAAANATQPRPTAPRPSSQPVRVYTAPQTQPVMAPTTPAREAEDHSLDIDWLTIFLGLVATVAVGGLIPFWLYIYLSLNPPVR